MHKNLHLFVSAVIIISVAFIYGFKPNELIPYFFGFEVETIELINMMRATMGLYLAIAGFWIVGIVNKKYWRIATIFNVVFMGGLAFGRVLSFLFDGFSSQFLIGLLLEVILLIWGLFNLGRYKLNDYEV